MEPTTLSKLIVRLADNKYVLGRRFSEWANGAPTLEAAVAAAAMTQDEVGHARSLYAALQGLPDSPEAYLEEERREQLDSLPELGQPFTGWADFVAASALFDRALALVFEAARGSSHEPLRQRSAKILQEERFHRLYGEAWLRRLAGAGPKASQAAQAAVSRLYGPTARWLEETATAELAAEGVLAEAGPALRARWEAEAQALLRECGLAAERDTSPA